MKLTPLLALWQSDGVGTMDDTSSPKRFSVLIAEQNVTFPLAFETAAWVMCTVAPGKFEKYFDVKSASCFWPSKPKKCT